MNILYHNLHYSKHIKNNLRLSQNLHKKKTSNDVLSLLAPPVGFEPTTLRLTAECSTAELRRNIGCGDYIFSRPVSRQVFSALQSLTSVFEMRTGGSSVLLPPQWLYNLSFDRIYSFFSLHINNCIIFLNTRLVLTSFRLAYVVSFSL